MGDEKIEKHHWEEMDKCIETLLRLSGSFHNKYKGAEGMAMIGREKYDTEEFEKKKMLLKGLENEKEHPKDEQISKLSKEVNELNENQNELEINVDENRNIYKGK